MSHDKRADMTVHGESPYNAEPPRTALADAPVTPIEAFYVRNHGEIPDVDTEAWRLRVDGLVGRALELSLGELRERFDEREVPATMQCAGNRRVGFLEVRDIPGEAPWGPGATGTAVWGGVRLADVLREAGVRDEAEHVAFLGADVSEEPDPPEPFGASIPRHKALADEVLLASTMNGEPLPRAHGAPVRVVVPGYTGARSVKWLERVTAQAEPSSSFFQATAYLLLPPDADPDSPEPGQGVPLGAVGLNSDILVPDEGDQVPAGVLRVAGYAYAGDDRRVVRVDVSTDGGAKWFQAELGEQPSAWTWRLWEVEVEVPAGAVDIVARAWDTSAASQPEDPGSLWNPKGYVNNAWARVSVHAR